ncbi:PREDICTED: protein transport protein Sec24C-like, partial [Pterocles gutturalis]|uniref:protein transport protein Sec24C-like n=1 Tax=Pterocles gutturalis TaxID=240206 RepID=UPI000528DC7E
MTKTVVTDYEQIRSLRAPPTAGAPPPASGASFPSGPLAYSQFGREDVQNGIPASTAPVQRPPASQPFLPGSAPTPVSQTSTLQQYGPPPANVQQLSNHMAGMTIGSTTASAPPPAGLGYGPPTSVPPVSGSFSATGSGLYTPYTASQGPPPTSVSQGLPLAQPPFPGQPISAQRPPTQVPGFAPPPCSTGIGPSSYPPTTGAPRPPTMPGPPLPGQMVAGPAASQPNHVSSPPPPSTVSGPHPGPPMSGLHGPPPPTHPPQPGYQTQQNGSFGQVRSPQPNYGGAYPGTPNYQPGPPPPPKRLDPDSIPSPIQVIEDDRSNRGSEPFVTGVRGQVPPLVTTNFLVKDQ